MEASSSWVIHPSGDLVGFALCWGLGEEQGVVLLVVLGGAVHSFGKPVSFLSGWLQWLCLL